MLAEVGAGGVPPVSESTTATSVTSTRSAPSSGDDASRAAKPPRKGTYTAINVAAVMSRRKLAMPSPSRQTSVPAIVTSNPSSSASRPPNQPMVTVSTPPTIRGTSGTTARARRTARDISQMPTPNAAASTSRKDGV